MQFGDWSQKQKKAYFLSFLLRQSDPNTSEEEFTTAQTYWTTQDLFFPFKGMQPFHYQMQPPFNNSSTSHWQSEGNVEKGGTANHLHILFGGGSNWLPGEVQLQWELPTNFNFLGLFKYHKRLFDLRIQETEHWKSSPHFAFSHFMASGLPNGKWRYCSRQLIRKMFIYSNTR